MTARSEDELYREVHSTLLRFARHHLANERTPSLGTVELVDSACRRVLKSSREEATSPERLKYLAWRAMVQVLIEHARKARSGRRIPQRLLVAIEEIPPAQEPAEAKLDRLCTLDDLAQAIKRRFSERDARVFLMEALTPLSREAISSAEGVSLRTVQRSSKRVYEWLDDKLKPRTRHGR